MLFIVHYYFIVCVCHIFFIHSYVDDQVLRLLPYFDYGKLCCEHWGWCVFHFSRYIPRSRIDRLYDSSILETSILFSIVTV